MTFWKTGQFISYKVSLSHFFVKCNTFIFSATILDPFPNISRVLMAFMKKGFWRALKRKAKNDVNRYFFFFFYCVSLYPSKGIFYHILVWANSSSIHASNLEKP